MSIKNRIKDFVFGPEWRVIKTYIFTDPDGNPQTYTHGGLDGVDPFEIGGHQPAWTEVIKG